MRHDLVPNDPATLPPQVKEYPADLPVTPLPRELPNPGVRASAVLAGAPSRSLALDAAQLGRVLFLGGGVVRTSEHRSADACCSGRPDPRVAKFPLEIYASTLGVPGVPDGVHWYDPVEHALVQIGPPAGGETTTLVVTGVPWRTGWRYAERGWRHIYWDGGTLLSQLAGGERDTAGLGPRLRTLFPDAVVRDLVGADGVHEFPVALVSLGDGRRRSCRRVLPSRETFRPSSSHSAPQAQRAGERDELGEPWPDAPALQEIPASQPLDEVVLRRGSQRWMDPGGTLPRSVVAWQMDAAMRGIDVPHWVVAHGVAGVAPGVYRWPDLDTPVRAGLLRDELLRIGLDQYLRGGRRRMS